MQPGWLWGNRKEITFHHYSSIYIGYPFLRELITTSQHRIIVTSTPILQLTSFTNPLAHWDLLMRSCLKFLGKEKNPKQNKNKKQGVCTALLRLSGPYSLELASVCNPSVVFLCFLQHKPQNLSLCRVIPSFPIINSVDLSSGGGWRDTRENVHVSEYRGNLFVFVSMS